MKLKLCLIFIMAFIIGCTKISINDADSHTQMPTLRDTKFFDETQRAVLGDTLEIPYTIENMKRAFESLQMQTKTGTEVDEIIITTHYYIKVTMKNDQEYDFMFNLGVGLFFLPLEIDVIKGGFIDNEGNPDGTIIRYCVVPVKLMEEIKRNNIEYEMISELFMPDEESDLITKNGNSYSVSLIEELVREAYIITNNQDWFANYEETLLTKSYTPHGRIRYKDSLVNGDNAIIGMEGLTVKAIRLTKTAEGICDKNGYYTCDKTFKYKWKYETSFERYDFLVRNGESGTFAYVSEKTTSPWSFTISDSHSKGHFMATVFRACHRYYYGDIHGLKRPPQNSFWKAQMKIAAIFEYDPEGIYGTTNMSRRFLGIGNPIKIYKDSSVVNLFDTTIHELCHASHWNHSKDQYDTRTDEMKKVRESLANGIAGYITSLLYPGWTGLDYGSDKYYTHIIDDLIDTNTSPAKYGKKAPYDKVEGYSIKQIEDAVVGVESTNEWKQNLYTIDSSNSTRVYLTELFDIWFN